MITSTFDYQDEDAAPMSGLGHQLTHPALPQRSQLEVAYDEFRSEREGNLVSQSTLQGYDDMLGRLLQWAVATGISTFGDLDVRAMRAYRLLQATRIGKHGRRLRPNTIRDSHITILTFLRWADAEGYSVDARIFELPKPRVPDLEPDVYDVDQLRAILAGCNPAVPQEALAVRILVGSGLRVSELCGLALAAPDGQSDIILGRFPGDRAELRVRWDGGAKGKKSRRVPVVAQLARAIRQYCDRDRPSVVHGELLINERREPYRRYGVDAIMDRLQRRVGFSVYAHAFRHTFATVATKFGWTFEHLRAAMGHADYAVLQRYVKLATTRDLGARRDWEEFIVADPTRDWLY